MFRKIIKAEFTMLIGEIKQYYLNYIFYNLSIVLLFYGLFYNFFSSDSSSEIISTLVCLVLWQICSNALQYLCYVIQDEAMMGTLEQMFVSKTNFIHILLAKIIVNMSFVLFKGILLFLVCSIIFGQIGTILTIDFQVWMAAFLICTITTFTFYCIGAIFGGLALYFKRISSILSIVDYLLLFFTGILNDVNSTNIVFRSLLNILPITQSNYLINRIFSSNFDIFSVVLFLIVCLCFVLFSDLCLLLLIKKAKENGKLGQY